MTVTFYNLSKRRNSTRRPGGGTFYNVIIKDRSSIINPAIILKWQGSGAPSYNYAYIQEYGRYYWVNNWTFEERCWTASLSVDVLASFKGQIGSSTKYVLRASADQNDNIVDLKFPPRFPLYTDQFPISLNWAQTFSAGDYVVSVVGYNNSFTVAGSSYYQVVPANLDRLINSVFTETENMWSSPLPGSGPEEYLAEYGLKFFKSIANPSQFINSIHWLPFKINPSTSPEMLYLGDLQTTAAGRAIADPIFTKTFEWRLPGSQDVGPAELDVLPFASWRLYMPPFGTFELDSRIIRQFRGIDGKIYVDVTNGEAVLEVCGHGQSAPVLIAQANIGSKISLSGSSVNYAQLAQTSINGAGSIINSALSGDLVGAVTGSASAMIDAAQAGAPTASNGGYGGGLAALRSFTGVVATYFTRTDPDWAEQGHPIMQLRQISSLSGYIKCADGDIQAPATEAELAQIGSFLTGGFFYE